MAAKILIVDDNPHVLRLLNITLSKAEENYDIVQAPNGEEAFEIANRLLPDLIISDVMMPKMDGIELCWMIRENSKIPMVPFIFLTSFEDQETAIRGFRAGADDYLNKPIDRKKLLNRTKELLNRGGTLKEVEKHADDRKGFSGDLKDLSIVELVQMLNLNKKSGVLKIHSASEGEIYLKDGHLWATSYQDKTGEEAFYGLVAETLGTFDFEIMNVDQDSNIENSTMNVIMEACRIMDETRNPDELGDAE